MIETIDFLIDKAVDIAIGFSLGILIIMLHRQADRLIHKKIEELHLYVTCEGDKLIREIHKTVEKEQSIDANVQKMINEQHQLIHEIHQL